jgi:hypothetical protein
MKIILIRTPIGARSKKYDFISRIYYPTRARVCMSSVTRLRVVENYNSPFFLSPQSLAR